VVALQRPGPPSNWPLPISEQQPLTADDLVATLIALHREQPPGCIGFEFSAERAEGRRGFFVRLDWLRGEAPRAAKTFRRHLAVFTSNEELLRSSGTPKLDDARAASAYDDLRHTVARALSTDLAQGVAIRFASRLE